MQKGAQGSRLFGYVWLTWMFMRSAQGLEWFVLSVNVYFFDIRFYSSQTHTCRVHAGWLATSLLSPGWSLAACFQLDPLARCTYPSASQCTSVAFLSSLRIWLHVKETSRMLKNTKGVCFLLLVCASEADNLRGNLNCFKVRLSNLIVDNFASCLCVSLYALFACSLFRYCLVAFMFIAFVPKDSSLCKAPRLSFSIWWRFSAQTSSWYWSNQFHRTCSSKSILLPS